MHSHTIPCPTEVFKLPYNVIYNTCNFSHEYVQRKIHGYTQNKFIDHVHLAHFDDPLVATPDVAMFRTIQQYIQEDIQRDAESKYEWRIAKQGPATWTVAITILFLLVVIVTLLAYQYRAIHHSHRKLTKHQREVKMELEGISSNYATYQKMDCANCANVIFELKAMNKALATKAQADGNIKADEAEASSSS